MLAALRTSARSANSQILRNALSLFGTTIVNSGSGFAFWWVAARLFSTSAVGSGSAAVSALQLLGMAGMVGLGTLLIAELPKGGPGQRELLSTALAVATSFGVVLALGFALFLTEVLPSARALPIGAGGIVLFVAGVAVTAALLVLDDATIGLSRVNWQLWRNTAFSILKLAILPLFAIGLHLTGSSSLVGAWVVGALLSTGLVASLARRAGTRLLGRPQWRLVRTYGGRALTHHWLNVSSVVPRLLLPVLVAAFLGAAVNAGFYIALLLIGFACIVPSHLSTALFAIASGDRTALSGVLRQAIFITALTGAASAAVFALGGRLMLFLFGPGYVGASAALAILGTATFATGVKAFYMAVCRVNGDLGRGALVSCGGSGLEVALPALALANHSGLTVMSLCWLITMMLEAIVLWPAVAKAARLRSGLPERADVLVRWTAPNTFRKVRIA